MGDFLQILTKVGTTLQDILIVLWICISAQNDKVSGSTRRGRPWAMEFSLGQGLLFMDVSLGPKHIQNLLPYRRYGRIGLW